MWPSSGALGPLGSVCGLPAWGEEDAPHGGAWVDGMAKSVAAGAQGGMTPPATCPKCGASWLGDPIPEAIAQDYSDRRLSVMSGAGCGSRASEMVTKECNMSALATLVVGLVVVIVGLFALVDWLLDERSRERHYQQRLERRRMGLEAAAMAPPRASGTKHGRVS